MKILSLFDGMACGALAMQAAGIEIDKYIAYEVDKYAIQTAQHNFPFIEERGDVFKADFTEYAGFDYLIGGSPCTYWSIAQTKNRETVASGMGWELFSQYVRALHEAKPRFFLYENNKSMSAAIRESITETFGFEPILINSALVSAQNRQRLYWCGIRQADGTYKKADIQQPADRGILLKDILETNQQTMVTESVQPLTEKEMDYMIRDHQDQRWSFCNKPRQEDKSKCLVANVHKGVPYNILAEPVNITIDGKAHVLKANYNKMSIANFFNGDKGMNYAATGAAYCVAQRGRYDESGKVYQHFEAQPTGKTNNLTTVSKDNLNAEPICVNSKSGRAGVEGLQLYEVKDGFITVKGKKYPIKLVDGFYIIRKLTVRECMRLQTVPEWYEWPVSKSQAYKMLGNGWTVEVIAHLLRSLK